MTQITPEERQESDRQVKVGMGRVVKAFQDALGGRLATTNWDTNKVSMDLAASEHILTVQTTKSVVEHVPFSMESLADSATDAGLSHAAEQRIGQAIQKLTP